MDSRFLRFSTGSLSALVVALGCATLSACAPSTAASPPSIGLNSRASYSTPSTEAPAQLIPRLQQAKALDEAELKDLTISLNRRGDLLDHEAAASNMIHALNAGIPVARDRLDYALAVPPAHLSSAQKSALADQLRTALRKDEAREQSVMAYTTGVYYEDANAPSVFDQQEELAQKEIAQLQRGEHVSWDAVQRALNVPAIQQ